jgi:hypothetical protein
MAGDPGVSQPMVDTQKLMTNITLFGDEPAYLGTFTPPSERGIAGRPAGAEIWLAFIRVNLVRLGEATAKLKRGSVNLEYSFYSLDRAAARELLIAPAPLDGHWEKLQPLLREKKAQFEHLVSVRAKSGQRAIVEEQRGVPDIEEFGPPGVTRSTETFRRLPNAGAPKGVNGELPTTPDEMTLERTAPPDAAPAGVPIGPDRRECGILIEVEPVVGPDAVTIDINHAIRSIGWLGDLKTTGIAVQYPLQPLFERRRITTRLTLFVGKHALVGTFDPPGANGVNERIDDGRTWLVFVRAAPDEP